MRRYSEHPALVTKLTGNQDGGVLLGVEMKQIPLSRGKFALVDDEDFEWLGQWKWYANKTGKGTWYVCTNTYLEDGRRTVVRMHRVLMSPKTGEEVDHKDGNGLNNQRNNLRNCSRQQNNFNKDKNKDNKSGYKGVFLERKTGKWVSAIKINRKTEYLGLFKEKVDAAKAYDKKAKELFGEFARLNFQEKL